MSVIEWPDNFYSALGSDRLDVKIIVANDSRRVLEVSWSGPVSSAVGEALVRSYDNFEEG